MDPELKTKWIEALRSGKYKQGNGWLEKDNHYCCLGVLCAIQNSDWKNSFDDNESLYTERLPNSLNAGLATEDRRDLAAKNDSGETFIEIADYIEKHLVAVPLSPQETASE
jgi:hypothetical protein